MTRSQFPELLTMSREECAKHIAGPSEICISIRSSQSEELPPVSANYRAVLRLQFDDWDFSDPPIDLEGNPHPSFMQITPEIGDQVIRFVHSNLDAKRLVVHCHAGISRSVSLAMAVANCFTGKEWRPRWLRNHTFAPGKCATNQIVYDTIVAAYVRRFPINSIRKLTTETSNA